MNARADRFRALRQRFEIDVSGQVGSAGAPNGSAKE